MNPLWLIAGIGGLFYFLNKQSNESRNLQPTTGGGTYVPPQLSSVPGFNSLPPDVQQQIIWIAANGTKAQLLSLADMLEKQTPANAPIANALRQIAATKAA